MAGELILVVDDERDIVEIVSAVLEGEGFRTLTAYDGQQALEALRRHHPNGMVLDIKMPGIDGLEVMRRLRADSSLCSTPVIVLTASQTTDELTRQLTQLGVSTWLVKPFEPADVVAAVSKAVSH